MVCRPHHHSGAWQQIAIDQIGRNDPAIPLADSCGELSRLRDEGKLRHVGASNFTVTKIDDG